ncbi:class I SAM-dependent methyltransferase [Glaciihabitans arcticus]|uniref:Class I SAM-dependent methyltransferase n=1 Tax=Glaciihabitans arcticus TaxID=2668039 RepID=A0A4Q9GSJ4_9MICO|nr:class I SAM-dependent methyltransferase [Glaciihabitans arcticus]TBN57114.1 class I SAM-dependent methyltransferase [Glaciihabitans arcticus]
MEPSHFYTGIVAELYGALKSSAQSWEPYAAFIDQSGQPALELGCGDGEPMLELLRRGYEVHGVDSSKDMLSRLRSFAREGGLDATVFCQRMEQLDLPFSYRSIFLAGPTITLLPDDETVLASLERIRAHLAEGGSTLVPLFVPRGTPPGDMGAINETIDADGAELRVTTVSQIRDEVSRTQTTLLRYEKTADGVRSADDREWLIHWHTPESFEELAVRAGLRVTGFDVQDGTPGEPGSEWTVTLSGV